MQTYTDNAYIGYLWYIHELLFLEILSDFKLVQKKYADARCIAYLIIIDTEKSRCVVCVPIALKLVLDYKLTMIEISLYCTHDMLVLYFRNLTVLLITLYIKTIN